MKSITKSLKDIGFLTIALTLALAANFAYGQWSNPPAAAPGGNVAAPINVSGDDQTKSGMLRVWTLNSNQVNSTNIQASGNIQANGGVRSSQYCDVNGLNCLTHAQIVNIVNNGGTPPPPSSPPPADCAARVLPDSGPITVEDLPAGNHLQVVNITTSRRSFARVPRTPTYRNWQCYDGTWNPV